MIQRKQFSELQELSAYMPIIGVLGPRQVGKTTLVKNFMAQADTPCIYLDMERPSDFQKLEEPELYFQNHRDKCVIIDEIQLRPELFALLRSEVDVERKPLRFIILGSASPDIIRQSSESLAGRISYIHLMPLSMTELDAGQRNELHFRGGFPESTLASSEKQAKRWLDDFISTYIERDLPLLGLPAAPMLTRRLWEMLAWQSGQLLNASAIGNSLGISYHTVKTYIDFIEGAFMIKTLQPFHANVSKRLVKSPKLYISDTGVLHRLLRIQSMEQLSGMPILGASFETFALQQILSNQPEDTDLYFYRTHAGTEVDFVLTRASEPVACIEVKYSSTPTLTKSLHAGIDDLKTNQNFIIVPESEVYQKKPNIVIAGLYPFIADILPNL